MAEEVKKLSETHAARPASQSASGGEESKKEVKQEKNKETPAEKVEEIKASKASTDASSSAKASEDKKVMRGKPSGKYKEIIEKIEKLSVLELSELVKELEDRFGVSAAAAPVAAAPAGDQDAGGVDEVSEKVIATLHLADSGAQKIAVIKALREINPDLGLKEAKDLADGAPKDIKADMPREEAEEAKKKLEKAGAKVELK